MVCSNTFIFPKATAEYEIPWITHSILPRKDLITQINFKQFHDAQDTIEREEYT